MLCNYMHTCEVNPPAPLSKQITCGSMGLEPVVPLTLVSLPLLRKPKSAGEFKLIPSPGLPRQLLLIAAALGGIRVEGKSPEVR